jgi:hypothetical protein
MKKFLKFMFWGFVALAAFGIAMSIGGGGESEPAGTSEPTKAAQEQPKEKVDPISKESFEKIVQGDSITGEGGMTIEEVEALLGEPDSKIESKSGDIHMIDYSYIGKDFQSISVNFTNGKVSFKSYME